jgi:signal transduction histidine kinase
MLKSLYMKLVLILLLLIISLMAVTGVFLNGAVARHFINEFNETMEDAFLHNTQFVPEMRRAAQDGDRQLWDVLQAYRFILGIGGGRRVYLLDAAGAPLYGAEGSGGNIDHTPNLLAAMMSGEVHYSQRMGDPFFDCAVPVTNGEGDFDFIVYIRDSKQRLNEQSRRLFFVILQALILGLTFSLFLSLLLSKTMTTPIEDLTRGAARVAAGDFSEKLEIHSRDEIGTLTQAFNRMGDALQQSLRDTEMAMEREAAEHNRLENLRREFVSNVSHELHTPLTGIKSYAETLTEPEELTDEEVKRFSSFIVSEADRMNRLVRDLLTLSRFDYGKLDWQITDFDITELLNRTYDMLRMEAKAFNHKLSLSFGTLPRTIRGDRDRIKQVLMNVIINAIRYTPEGGNIDIAADSGKKSVVISVRDDGIGIPEEDLPHIFERFYRVDKARSSSMGGTGLGLAIAKEIMDNHGGGLTVKSKPGEGTTVTITLPGAAL